MTKPIGPVTQQPPPGNEVAIRQYQRGPSLDQVRSGERLIRDGQYGPSVGQLQQLLADAGVDIMVDNRFGPNSEAAVRAFQRAQGLAVDGLVGPQTLGALERVAAQRTSTVTSDGRDTDLPRRGQDLVNGGLRPDIRRLTPLPEPGRPVPDLPNTGGVRTPIRRLTPLSDPVSTTQPTTPPTIATTDFAPEPGRVTTSFAGDRPGRVAQGEDILKANGQWPPVEGRLYVIQIDQDNPPASASRNDRAGYLRNYTGQTVVFQGAGGHLVEKTSGPLASASHPGQFTSRAGTFTSVDGDDIPDIAHLRSGVYEYRGRANSSGRFNPTSHRSMKVARDINHNGVIDGDREQNSDFYATYLQIHAGGNSSPSSVGCQTLPPDAYREFSNALAPARDGTFTYLLVRRPNDRHGENRF